MKRKFNCKRFFSYTPSTKPSTLRRGQTAVEYLLVTVALTVAFAMVYRTLQWYLASQFTSGGVIILRMYQEDPW